MKEIKIKRLSLENFKCHAALNLNLEGGSVSIYGDNATGKTSIYDAFVWLLFGKDSMGNGEKGIDIKPLDSNGEVKDHQAITSAEAEFLVDGEAVTFRRTYRESWTTRRGSAAAVYEGNTSDYFVDGVPCKKNAFDAKIRELVSEELFRMLTSVSYFASGMKWQDRRAVLFDMAGTLTDRQIMERDAAFRPLLESLGKLSIPEYKAKLLSQRKGLTGIREDAPARLNECQRILRELEGINFEKAREDETRLALRKDMLTAELIALDQDTALEKKRLALRQAKLERDTLESRNRSYRESQKSTAPELGRIRNVIAAEKRRLEEDQAFLESAGSAIHRYEKELQSSRELYVQVNGEAFVGGVCPTCGQRLPFEQLQEATRGFNRKKEQRLAAILENTQRLQEERKNAQERIARIESEIRKRRVYIQEMENQLSGEQREPAVVMDLPEYAASIAEANRSIDGLQTEISRLMADSAKVRDTLRGELDAVNGQLRSVQGMIAREAVREQTERRIEELKADAKAAAEALERIEGMLRLMEEFTRFKARFVEGSVNDLFRIAAFRLFREQANGGLEERCDVVYGGVPYMGLNNGMKINVGIDIINALSRHYGVTVPLFVDNAEAVTRLEGCNAQVIRLVVSEEDKALRIL